MALPRPAKARPGGKTEVTGVSRVFFFVAIAHWRSFTYVTKVTREALETMQRVVLAVVFVVVVIAIGAILVRGMSRLFQTVGPDMDQNSGGAMQRIAFFLLLAVMVYAIMSGAT